MGEVDQFLDEVEAELARLTKENDDLRNKLSAAQTGGAAGFEPQATQQTPVVEESAPEPEPEPEPEPAVVAAAAAVAAAETIRVETVPAGLQRRGPAARDRDPQRRRARRPGQGRGRQDHRRGPDQGRAPRRRVQDQGRPPRVRRPHPRPDARLRDRRASYPDVRRARARPGQAQRRGREPAGLRARVPLPAQELLHPAARVPGRSGRVAGRWATTSRRPPSGCARSSATKRAERHPSGWFCGRPAASRHGNWLFPQAGSSHFACLDGHGPPGEPV